jgi:hypothetical protein
MLRNRRKKKARAGMNLTREQRRTVVAAYLGWTLDAFDFFL